jgi:hypothetical protein
MTLTAKGVTVVPVALTVAVAVAVAVAQRMEEMGAVVARVPATSMPSSKTIMRSRRPIILGIRTVPTSVCS